MPGVHVLRRDGGLLCDWIEEHPYVGRTRIMVELVINGWSAKSFDFENPDAIDLECARKELLEHYEHNYRGR